MLTFLRCLPPACCFHPEHQCLNVPLQRTDARIFLWLKPTWPVQLLAATGRSVSNVSQVSCCFKLFRRRGNRKRELLCSAEHLGAKFANIFCRHHDSGSKRSFVRLQLWWPLQTPLYSKTSRRHKWFEALSSRSIPFSFDMLLTWLHSHESNAFHFRVRSTSGLRQLFTKDSTSACRRSELPFGSSGLPDLAPRTALVASSSAFLRPVLRVLERTQ